MPQQSVDTQAGSQQPTSAPPPVPSNLPTSGTPGMTSDRINSIATAQSIVANLNQNLIYNYNLVYQAWATMMGDGATLTPDRQVPPVPPMAWELTPPDVNGLVFYQQGNTPVCPQGAAVPYAAGNAQPNTLPNVIMIGGQNGNTKWYSALKGDTFPNGMVTPPQPDGHAYEKFGAPVGPGWYLQVS